MSRTNPRPLVSAVTVKFFGISNLISFGLAPGPPLRLGSGVAATLATELELAGSPRPPFARTRASIRSSRHSRANLSSTPPIYFPLPPTMTSFLSSERLEDFTSEILIAIVCHPPLDSRTLSTAISQPFPAPRGLAKRDSLCHVPLAAKCYLYP